jgi:hypothetical protein
MSINPPRCLQKDSNIAIDCKSLYNQQEREALSLLVRFDHIK